MGAKFQLRKSLKGEKYWYGGDDTNRSGDDSFSELILNAEHFEIGSILNLTEPCEPDENAIDRY